MLQAGRVFMFFKGYRPKGEYKHLSVVHFVSCFSDQVGSDLVKLFDKVRRRRHIAVYETPKTVSESEAENALAKAEEFINVIKKLIR